MTKPIIKYSLLGMILSTIGCCNTTKYVAVNEKGTRVFTTHKLKGIHINKGDTIVISSNGVPIMIKRKNNLKTQL